MDPPYKSPPEQWMSRSGVILDPSMISVAPPQPPPLQPKPSQHPPQLSVDILSQSVLSQSDSGLSESSPISTARGGVLNPLMDADISMSNFSKVINFGALPHATQPTGGDGTQCHDDSYVATDGDESSTLLQNATIIDNELLEQSQNLDQSRLLERFQELRRLQLQQQEQLMLQQQAQMSQLHAEQQRIQEMLLLQRQKQWGPGVPHTVASQADTGSDSDKIIEPSEGPQLMSSRKAMTGSTYSTVNDNRTSTVNSMLSAHSVNNDTLPADTVCEDTLSARTASNDTSSVHTVVSHSDSTLRVSAPRHASSRLPSDDDSDADDCNGDEYCTGQNSDSDCDEQPVGDMCNSDDNDDDVDDAEFDEDYNEDEDRSSCDDEGDDTGHQQDFDEMPVAGQKKSFEQLLEEQLQKDQLQQSQSTSQPSTAADSRAAPRFLRKGQGISRFYTAPSRRKAEAAAALAKTKSRQRSTDRSKHRQPSKDRSTYIQHSADRTTRDKSTGRPPATGGASSLKPGKEDEVKPARTKSKPSTSAKATAKTKSSGSDKKDNGHSVGDARTTKHNNVQSSTNSTASQSCGGSSGSSKTDKPSVIRKTASSAASKNGSKSASNSKVVHREICDDLNEKLLRDVHRHSQCSSSVSTASDGAGQHSVNQPSVTTAAHHDSDRSPDEQTYGETSFQHHMDHLAKQEEVEKHELDEFEILEHYADENVSFMSNASDVNNAMANKQMPLKQPHGLSRTPTKPLKARHSSSPPAHCSDSSSDTDEADVTLSNTEHKHEQPTHSLTKPKRSISPHLSPSKKHPHGAAPPSPRKRSSATRNTTPRPIYSSEFCMSSSSEEASDCTSDEAGGSNKKGGSTKKKHKSGGSRSGAGGNRDPVRRLQFDDTESWTESSIDVDEGSRSKASANQQLSSRHHHHATYSDSDSDSSSSEEVDGPSVDVGRQIHHSALTKPSKVSAHNPQPNSTSTTSASDLDRPTAAAATEKFDVPPTSKLVTKIFPQLKPKPPPQPQQPAASEPITSIDGVQSKQLRDKLQQLEAEIERFREENAKMAKLRQQREQELSFLKKEMSEFETQKTQELERLKEYKEEEMKKLKNERRLFDRYQKSIRSMPDKRDREEITELKSQLTALQQEMSNKESRWGASTSRLKGRIEHLEQENTELKEELRVVEKRRLEQWQKAEANKKTCCMCNGQIAKASTNSTATASARDDRITAEPRRSQLNIPAKPPPAVSPPHPTPMSPTHTQPAPPTQHTNNSDVTSDTASHTSVGVTNHIPRKHAATASVSSTTASIRSSFEDMTDFMSDQYEETRHLDGKIEKVYSNGGREILFTNGTRKQISADGAATIITYFNGDKKHTLPDQREIYYYKDTQTTHTTYPDGLQVLKFSNNQIEKHFPDGTKEITFPNHNIRYFFPGGKEETIYTDGTVVTVDGNTGEEVKQFPNGQREIYTQDYKRREFPDGTVKTIYHDGRQETRYSSGRVRVKDPQGNIIVDKRVH